MMLPKRFRIGKVERMVLMMLKSQDKPLKDILLIKGGRRILNNLIRKGLVERVDTDKGVFIRITPLGKSFV